MNLRILSPVDRIRLVTKAPSLIRLSYRLLRDPRVPILPKALTVAAIVFVLSPIDVPGWIPVIGQAGDILVIVNVLDFFITSAPRHIVQEHITALGLEGKFKI